MITITNTGCPPRGRVITTQAGRQAIQLLLKVSLGGETHMAGPALTVGCTPADILALKAAVSFVQPGDVVVSTNGAFTGAATMGDLVAGRLKNAGAVGFVTDGAVRDATGIIETGLHVWCQGRTPASPFSNGPGTLGLPISIGNQRVECGDMVIADGDGVVVVPFERIDEIAAKVSHILSVERTSEEKVKTAQQLTKTPKPC